MVWVGDEEGDINIDYVVWTALDDNVYVYRISSGIYTKITDNSPSGFEAKISENHIAWRGYKDCNWEIFLSELSMKPIPLD